MDVNTTVSIGVLIAICGAFIGIMSFMNTKTQKATDDGKWRGSVDTKLDTIIAENKIVAKTIGSLDYRMNEFDNRLSILENEHSMMHKRGKTSKPVE